LLPTIDVLPNHFTKFFQEKHFKRPTPNGPFVCVFTVFATIFLFISGKNQIDFLFWVGMYGVYYLVCHAICASQVFIMV
jgi:hypothetical protein